MSIHSQLNAKVKAIDVIESCNTIAHILSAKNYIKLYYKKFEDELGYLYLKRELESKSTLISRKEQSYGKK